MSKFVLTDLRRSVLPMSIPMRLVAQAVAYAMPIECRSGHEWLIDYPAVQARLTHFGRPMSVATVRDWIAELVAVGVMFRDGHRVGFVDQGKRKVVYPRFGQNTGKTRDRHGENTGNSDVIDCSETDFSTREDKASPPRPSEKAATPCQGENGFKRVSIAAALRSFGCVPPPEFEDDDDEVTIHGFVAVGGG